MKRSDILAGGFGIAVAMWGAGYVCRLPFVMAPAWLLLSLLVICLFCGSYLVGTLSSNGWKAGLQASLLSSVLNLLILGSLLSGDRPNAIVPSALLWFPGSILLHAVLGAAGGLAGGSRKTTRKFEPSTWTSALAFVAAAAAMLLMLIGGLVTSKKAGLAVVDWPNSFGYNMFLYPLSRMTGDIYFEHAHRLFGALFGFCTLILAAHLHFVEKRAWVRRTAYAILCAVALQGLLGGLRVTGVLTLSQSREAMSPSTLLALIHGTVGQMIFAGIVALSAFLSVTWQSELKIKSGGPTPADGAATNLLLVVLVAQLALGAALRHFQFGVWTHITMAMVVISMAVAVGVRAWGLNEAGSVLNRLGIGLMALVGIQFTLGVCALVATRHYSEAPTPPLIAVIASTSHQAVGSILLALSTALWAWTRRFLMPEKSVDVKIVDGKATGKATRAEFCH